MIKIRVKPNSNESSITHVDEIYVVRVKEPADKDKANKAVVKLLSKHFGKKCRIKIGSKSKDKYIEFLE